MNKYQKRILLKKKLMIKSFKMNSQPMKNLTLKKLKIRKMMNSVNFLIMIKIYLRNMMKRKNKKFWKKSNKEKI